MLLIKNFLLLHKEFISLTIFFWWFFRFWYCCIKFLKFRCSSLVSHLELIKVLILWIFCCLNEIISWFFLEISSDFFINSCFILKFIVWILLLSIVLFSWIIFSSIFLFSKLISFCLFFFFFFFFFQFSQNKRACQIFRYFSIFISFNVFIFTY